MCEKEVSFYFQIVMEMLFSEMVQLENLYNPNFTNFAMKTAYLILKFVLDKNQSGWSMTSHSVSFEFSSFYFFGLN